MEKHSFTIRSLHTAEELGMVRDLECLVWASDDPVPVHQTITVVKHGGMVLGAFEGDRLIGFQYSFAGFDGKKPTSVPMRWGFTQTTGKAESGSG
ncbi:hypothetical protein [Brevibacillus massiliensis]|uniref:hypothetical protein n=1 Tax=Brevibacillus massiliensis TaxID=1118054 RepID=UPI0002F4A2A0|nr:hypothetical protein [Brevibacillus massiliensis]